MSDFVLDDALLDAVDRLASVAVGLCRDAGVSLEVAPGGWSWDPVRRVIRVSLEGLRSKGPDACAAIIAHEVGHYLISRYLLLPVSFPSLRAGWLVLNGVEDPRVDQWMARRFPGVRRWQLSEVEDVAISDAAPWLLQFVVACAKEGDTGFTPLSQQFPPEVAAALDETRAARLQYARTAPPTDLELPVGRAVVTRWFDEVLPLRPELRWIPRAEEQRIQVSARDALRLAEARILPVAERLYRRDRQRIAGWLASSRGHAQAGRSALEAGGVGPVVGRALQEGGRDGPVPDWADQMAGELLEGGLGERVAAPLVGSSIPRVWSGAPPLRSGPPRSPGPWAPSSAYDRDLASVASQIDALSDHLERVLRPRRRLRERAGHPWGRRVDVRRAMQFEADPRRYDEMWIRASIPDRRDTAILLLVDLSGSMSGEKACAALLGTILVAETLNKVGIPFAIEGFQDVLVPMHAFGEPFSKATRDRIAGIPQEVAGNRPGGNNCPGYNDDGPCLQEAAAALLAYPATDRVLIVVSDGIPEGRRSTADDLARAVASLSKPGVGLRLIGLGLGAGTEHVRTYYPEAVANVPVPEFAERIGALVESVVLRDP